MSNPAIDIRIEKYRAEDKTAWDDFVAESKNGTFLFFRDFMEYHSDRFTDHSFLFFLNNKLIALLPANIENNILYSHQGLTYGGLILSAYTKAAHVLHIFDCFKTFASHNNISKIIYKTVPYIYHKQPSEEDLYALFRNDAQLTGRGISSCIDLQNPIWYSELRERGIKKAKEKSLLIKESTSFDRFWKILEENLQNRYNVSPTHTLNEIEYLKSKFPDNIRLFEVWNPTSILGGCITFETLTTRHIQYISASEDGKKDNVLDFLFDYLILDSRNKFKYFDFGISTEKNGLFLNEGLISQKEGFGARAIVYDIYELTI